MGSINKLSFFNKDTYAAGIVPTKNTIPNWYKQIKANFDGTNEVKINPGSTVKNCFPFLDSLISGYSILLNQDVEVSTTKEGALVLDWRDNNFPPISFRPQNAHENIPIDNSLMSDSLVWQNTLTLHTQNGYSAIFTHPLNRHDLPFITSSGIVDLDRPMAPGNIPFFMKKNFNGIIEQGTPIMQIIPFKRENWALEKNEKLLFLGEQEHINSLRKIRGYYKKNVWQRKEYN